MQSNRHDKVHIWPQLAGNDKPESGWFAVKLGKDHAERPLSVHQDDGRWYVHLDGRSLAKPTEDWRVAFGRIYRERTMLTGRRITGTEYIALRRQRDRDAAAGIDADKPINLSTARAPF